MINALERLALTAWAGGLWVIGYLVSPLLYRHFDDTVTAAAISGELTGAVAWLSLVCAAVLIPAQLRHRVRPIAAHWRFWLLAIMLALIAIGEFWVRPDMASLDPEAIEVSYLAALRASESIYFVASFIALVLVLGGLQPASEGNSGQD
nr:DUF4149 domain-containing protein [Halorhodospira halochloris]